MTQRVSTLRIALLVAGVFMQTGAAQAQQIQMLPPRDLGQSTVCGAGNQALIYSGDAGTGRSGINCVPLSIDGSGSVSTLSGNITTTNGTINDNNVTATNTVSGSSLTATNTVSGNNVTATNAVNGATVTATGNITTTSGAVDGANVNATNGNVTASGNITTTSGTVSGANVSATGGSVTATGNISTSNGNLTVSGNGTSTGNITAAGTVSGNTVTATSNATGSGSSATASTFLAANNLASAPICGSTEAMTKNTDGSFGCVTIANIKGVGVASLKTCDATHMLYYDGTSFSCQSISFPTTPNISCSTNQIVVGNGSNSVTCSNNVTADPSAGNFHVSNSISSSFIGVNNTWGSTDTVNINGNQIWNSGGWLYLNYSTPADGWVMVGGGTSKQGLYITKGDLDVANGMANFSSGATITNAGSQWSGWNVGPDLILEGGRNNGLAILDSNNSNPWGIFNAGGSLVLASMPPLSNTTLGPHIILQLEPTGNVEVENNTVVMTNSPGNYFGSGGTLVLKDNNATAVSQSLINPNGFALFTGTSLPPPNGVGVPTSPSGGKLQTFLRPGGVSFYNGSGNVTSFLTEGGLAIYNGTGSGSTAAETMAWISSSNGSATFANGKAWIGPDGAANFSNSNFWVNAGGSAQFAGTVYCMGGCNTGSDMRLKKDIKPITNGLNLVEKLQGVHYNWRPASEREVGKDLDLPVDKPQVGFIAQEVEKILPEAVTKTKDGIYTLQESKIIPLLVEGMKEQQAEIEALKAALANKK